MDDQRTPDGEVPLSALFAPSVYLTDGGKLKRLPPSDRYIAACRVEGLRVPERKILTPDPVDASGWGSETQFLYVKLAAKEGDWRSLKGTKPTPKMQDLFVTTRAKYLAWKHRHAADPVEILPAVEAPTFAQREIIFPDIDTSKTCPRCRMRRIEPGRALCGNCIRMEEP